MQKPLKLSDFPPDVQKIVCEICTNAILRAIKNGTFKMPEQLSEEKRSGQPEQ